MLLGTGVYAGAAERAPPLAVGARDEAQSQHRARQVKQQFLNAWSAYERYDWGHDELQHSIQQPRDWYGMSLLVTPVESD